MIDQPSSIPTRKPMAIYAITKHGLQFAEQLEQNFPNADRYVSERHYDHALPGAHRLSFPVGPALRDTFAHYDCHVMIFSLGAIVRLIAPLLKSKKTDPAVVCIDETGRYAICVLSGHFGRGNEFAQQIAQAIGAQAILTTASDALDTLRVDILGRELGWILDDMDRNITRGCAAVVNGAPTLVMQDSGEPQWWPLQKPLPPGVEYLEHCNAIDPSPWEILLIISDRLLDELPTSMRDKAIVYRPKTLSLGIGCDRDAPFEMVERGVLHILKSFKLSPRSVKDLATIDIKCDEQALLELASRYQWPLRSFDAKTLDGAEGIENPSETVFRFVGSHTVAEGAALLAASTNSLLVPKQRYSEPGIRQSMTLAVARIPHPRRSQNETSSPIRQ